MNRQSRAMMLASAAVLFWSTAASAFKLTLARLDPLSMLVWSSATSTVFLLGIAAVRGKFGILAGMTVGEWGRSAVLGFLNPFLYYVTLFTAYKLLSAQEALVLNYTWPIMLVLLSAPLLGQQIRPGSIAALAVSFSGVVVIVTRGNFSAVSFSNPLGVSLALSTAVVWGIYWIFNMRDRRDEVVKLAANFLFGTFYTVIAAAVFTGLTIPDIGGLVGSVYIGLFEMGITFVLWLTALSTAETTASVSNLVYVSPFLSLIWIRIVVGEQLALSTIAGLVCIVTGILIERMVGRST